MRARKGASARGRPEAPDPANVRSVVAAPSALFAAFDDYLAANAGARLPAYCQGTVPSEPIDLPTDGGGSSANLVAVGLARLWAFEQRGGLNAPNAMSHLPAAWPSVSEPRRGSHRPKEPRSGME